MRRMTMIQKITTGIIAITIAVFLSASCSNPLSSVHEADEDFVEQDAEKLALEFAESDYEDGVMQDIDLPEPEEGTSVTWQSSHPDVVDPETGEVTRPSHDEDPVDVTLTATLTFETGKTQQEFNITVQPLGAVNVTFDYTSHDPANNTEYDATAPFDNDNDGQDTITVDEGGSLVPKPDEDPAWQGYVFGGWYADYEADTEQVSNKWDFDNDTVEDETTSITLYAKWTANDYTVTFEDPEDGTYETTETVTYGETYTLPDTVPTRENYSFEGWYTEPDGGGDEITDNTDMRTASDHTLYAQWVNWPLTVSYEGNGNSSGTPPSDVTVNESDSDQTVTVEGRSDMLGPTIRDGITQRFLGWKASHDGATYNEGDTIDIGEEKTDVTLTARWTTVNDVIGKIGPAGGYIFYEDTADDYTWTYLEAAPEGTEWTNTQWGDKGTEIGGDAQGTAIGDGQANTNAIVDHMDNASITGTAAQQCDGLSEGGYSDWFLPSKDELEKMYENLHDINSPVGGFASDLYWSSSELSDESDWAWTHKFSTGHQHYTYKDYDHYVRAVRSFK